jgi:hypothetical protein
MVETSKAGMSQRGLRKACDVANSLSKPLCDVAGFAQAFVADPNPQSFLVFLAKTGVCRMSHFAYAPVPLASVSMV